MIWLYYGTGGSGKSLDMANDVMVKIRRRHQNVIANFPCNLELLYRNSKNHGLFYFFDNDFMTVKNLIAYAKKFHKRGVEGQTLLCIDECQFFFDPRDNKRRDRRAWLKFFTQHRKLGFNVILTTPALSLIDRQILGCVEYTVRHRKANNGGIIGHLIPVSLFCAITRWNGVNGSEGIVERRFFKYSKTVSNIYDSYRFFGDAADDASNVSYVNMRIERKEPVDREA